MYRGQKRDKQISLLLPSKLHEQVKTIARIRETTTNDLIVTALRNLVHRNTQLLEDYAQLLEGMRQIKAKQDEREAKESALLLQAETAEQAPAKPKTKAVKKKAGKAKTEQAEQTEQASTEPPADVKEQDAQGADKPQGKQTKKRAKKSQAENTPQTP